LTFFSFLPFSCLHFPLVLPLYTEAEVC
jgi:hypothetical protein